MHMHNQMNLLAEEGTLSISGVRCYSYNEDNQITKKIIWNMSLYISHLTPTVEFTWSGENIEDGLKWIKQALESHK
jgi:hypothetical protein